MNIKIELPPFFLEVILQCQDASNPPANVENWIEEGKLYKLKGLTKAENTDDISVIIADKNGKIIKPSKEFGGFKPERLTTAFELCKN